MIKVLRSGLLSTIQDQGRLGFQIYGVPISGVMDSYSANLANLLLGNDENAAVMEITLIGPRLLFNSPTSLVLTGADLSPSLNENSIDLNTIHQVQIGDVLSFGPLKKGIRAYMAVKGGFTAPMIMKSRSMYANITNVAVLKSGDELQIESSNSVIHIKNASIKMRNNHFDEIVLDAYIGPEFDNLDDSVKHLLGSSIFTISNDHNRMGYRLEELVPNEMNQLLTSPVLPGTVQLTPSGRIIILMRDAQTTGGYPRILQLADNAMNILSQKKTGDQIRFKLMKTPI